MCCQEPKFVVLVIASVYILVEGSVCCESFLAMNALPNAIASGMCQVSQSVRYANSYIVHYCCYTCYCEILVLACSQSYYCQN